LSFSVGPAVGGIQLTDANCCDGPVTAITANGLGNVAGVISQLPYDGNSSDNNTLFIFENGFTGQYTFTNTCAGFATLTPTNNDGFGDASLLIVPTAVTTGCTITIGDGTNSIVLPMTVTTTTVTGS
jgi:hypothetical protein